MSCHVGRFSNVEGTAGSCKGLSCRITGKLFSSDAQGISGVSFNFGPLVLLRGETPGYKARSTNANSRLGLCYLGRVAAMNKNQRATPALFQREPAMVIGSIEAFLIAVVALVAFLLGWGGETVALVVGVVSAGIAVASSLVTRSKVASYAEVIAGD